MATDDQQVLVVGQGPTPQKFTVPGNGQIRPKSVFATYDGSAAAVPFQPALKVISDGGEVVGIYPAQTVAAGGSASVSWFRGLGGTISAGTVAVVGARIEAHSAQSIPDSANTDFVYDTVAFDTAAMANLGADARKLTVTVSGLYLVTCASIWTFDTAGRRLNVVTYNNFYSASSASVIASATSPAVWTPVGGLGGGAPHTDNVSVAIVQASAGDFFASGGLQSSGGALNVNGLASGTNQDNFLSAILLGKV
jgi:hypothetical protein